jgi:hypothetical protein
VSVKRLLTVIVSFNACAWPGIFAAYAVVAGDQYRILGYTAAGVVFGGVVLLCRAGLMALLASRNHDRRLAADVSEASLPPRKIAVGGLILIAIGTACFICEWFRYKPSHERSAESQRFVNASLKMTGENATSYSPEIGE